MARPIGATILFVILAIASIWWISLGLLYFFGSFWFWYRGFPFAFVWGIIYGLMGIFGLGLAGGLAAGYQQAYTTTLVLAIIFLIFSIPALVNGYDNRRRVICNRIDSFTFTKCTSILHEIKANISSWSILHLSQSISGLPKDFDNFTDHNYTDKIGFDEKSRHIKNNLITRLVLCYLNFL